MEGTPTRRRMSRRSFLQGAAVALGSTALSACTGWSTQGVVQPGPGQVVINAWFWDDSLQTAIDAFHQKQDHIRVNFTKTGYDYVHNQLLTSLVAGTGAPDVSAIEIGFVSSFVGRGGLLDLSTRFGADQFKNDIVAYKWIQGSTTDGRLYCMPWDIGPTGFWYRADIFESAGLETDPTKLQAQIKTWEDWFKLGETLAAKKPSTRLIANAYQQDLFLTTVEQKGHGWFDGNRVLAVEKGTPALQRAAEARRRGIDADIPWFSAEFDAGVKKDAFAAMNVACWMQSGLMRDQPQSSGKWRVIHVPEGDLNQGGSFLTMPVQTKLPNEAWEFMRFVCCSAEGQNAIFKKGGIFPAYKPAWQDPAYDEPVPFFGGQRTYRLWADIADKVPASPVSPYDRQANDIINNEVTKAQKLGKDPVQAMQDAQTTILRRVPADLTA